MVVYHSIQAEVVERLNEARIGKLWPRGRSMAGMWCDGITEIHSRASHSNRQQGGKCRRPCVLLAVGFVWPVTSDSPRRDYCFTQNVHGYPLSGDRVACRKRSLYHVYGH